MSIFSNIFNIKEKKEIKKESIYAPISGKLVSLTEVKDDTFAEKLLGDGIAIDPINTEYILSPIDGIVDITPTMHAFTVISENDIEVLVHFGLDTVKLNGKGFEALVKTGDKVKKGDKIIKCDYEFIHKYAPSLITPVIILDSDKCNSIKKHNNITIKEAENIIIEVEK